MPRCSQCNFEFAMEDADSNTCPKCGQLLSDNGTDDKPNNDAGIDATIESHDVLPPTDQTVRTDNIDWPADASTIDGQFISGRPDNTERSDVTTPQDDFLQTIESGESCDIGVPPRATIDSGTLDSDSHDLSFQVAGQSSDSADADSSSSTVDSHDIEPAEVTRINEMWGKVVTRSPTVTIKSDQSKEVQSDKGQVDSSLVIQQREIGPGTKRNIKELDYSIVERIGEGGMGLVFGASQASLDREVAVKVLKPTLVASPSQRRKFLSEAVVTGELEHPGIIPIYDLGRRKDGTLFYSMKRVHGTPWSAVIHDKSLTENLEILMRVSDAVAFAHSREVIHRDLKPENIMLGEFGEVLVLDWGLAVSLATDSSSANVARISSMGGTPAYMSPEMAAGPLEKIGKCSDIYLLGAILYECITGRLPRQRENVTACLYASAKNEIDPTEKSGELVDIALIAMSTNCEDRFESVAAFQAAIRTYQSHTESIALTTRAKQDLITARESRDYEDFSRALFGFEESLDLWDENEQAAAGIVDTRLEYASCAHAKGDFDLGLSLLHGEELQHREMIAKLSESQAERDARFQRLRTARRIVIGLAAFLFIAITTGSVLVWQAKREADSQRDIAETERKDAVAQRREALNQKRIASENEQDAREQERIANEQRQVALTNEREAIEQRRVALKNEQEAIDQREKAEYEAYVALIGLAAVKIDERAFSQAVSLLQTCKQPLRNWEWGRLMFLCRPSNTTTYDTGHRIEDVAFSADGGRLAAAGFDGVVRVWDTKEGKSLGQLALQPANTQALAIAFSPVNSDQLVIGTNLPDRSLQLWNLTENDTRSLPGHADAVVDVQFSRDGKRVLTASKDNTAAIWDVATGKIIQRFRGHDWWVWDAAFSPDEQLVVTASEDGTARIWHADTGEQYTNAEGEPTPFTGHHGAVFAAAFSSDGRLVATGGFDKCVMLWKPSELAAFDYEGLLKGQPGQTQQIQVLSEHSAAISRVVFSQDGKFIMSAGHDNSLVIWSACSQTLGGVAMTTGAPWKTLRGHSSQVRSAVFSPIDSNRIASASYDGLVRIWSIRDYAEEHAISGTVLRGHADAILAANFSPTGDYVITASRDRTAKTWDPDLGSNIEQYRQGHRFLLSGGVFYPDGTKLLTAAGDGTARVWNSSNESELFVLRGIGRSSAVALSTNGRWIVTGLSFGDGASDPESPAANSQGSAVAAIWDAETGDQVRTFFAPPSNITAVAFSHDASLIYGGDGKGNGYIWLTETGQLRETLKWHTGQITDAEFVHDDKTLLTASADNTVCQWRIGDGKVEPQESLVLKHRDGVNDLCISGDGRYVLTGDKSGTLTLWQRETAAEIWANSVFASGNATSVDISPDGQMGLAVVACDETGDRLVSRFTPLTEPDEFSEFRRFRGQDIWSATFAPDGASILILGGDEAVLWNLDGTAEKRFSPHRTVSYASYSPDGKQVVTAGWDHVARIWDTVTGDAITTLSGSRDGANGGHKDRVHSAVFSADGKQVLTAGEDGVIILWDAVTASVVRTYRGHTAGVSFATFSPDGRYILSASKDHTARIWDRGSGKEVRCLAGHSLPVWRATYSANGNRVITASEDTLAKTWDVATGAELQTFRGHTAGVNSAAFSPDGKRVLTGSTDQTAKLWDAANGKEILSLKGHKQAVTSVAISRDGKKVLTGSRDGTAVIWPAVDWDN